jgi:hypothetical protein
MAAVHFERSGTAGRSGARLRKIDCVLVGGVVQSCVARTACRVLFIHPDIGDKMMLRRRICVLLLGGVLGALGAPARAQEEAPARVAVRGHTSSGGLANQYTLLWSEPVQQELELTAVQKELLQEMRDMFRSSLSPTSGRGRTARLRAASSPEERQRVQEELDREVRSSVEAMRKLEDANGARIAAALSDAQKKRLRQLWVQWQAERAFVSNARVVAELELTDEQLHALVQKSRPTVRSFALRESEAAKQARLAKVLEVLTTQQREKYAALRGEDFEFGDRLGRVGRTARGPRGHPRGASNDEGQDPQGPRRTLAVIQGDAIVNGLSHQYSLLWMEDVREELDLSEKVLAVLEEIRSDSTARIAEHVERNREAPIQQRGADQRAFSQSVRDAAESNGRRIAAMLTDAQQQRLAQLWVQALGEKALTEDEEVIARLKIGEDQVEDVREAVRRMGRLGPRSTKADFDARLAAARNLLTEAQRRAFDELCGEEFAFSSIAQQRKIDFSSGFRGGRIGSATGVAPTRSKPRAETTGKNDRYLTYARAYVKKYDKNGDGVLGEDEWSATPLKTLLKPAPAETSDGKITPEELADWLRNRSKG